MTPNDALIVNAAHADFAGFVFAPSRHQISPATARLLKQILLPEISTVGVFVNESIDEIINIFKMGLIDVVQLHRKSNLTEITTLQKMGLKVIQAVDVQSTTLNTTADYILFDSSRGSGKKIDLTYLSHPNRPFMLAGGLTPDNVYQIVKTMSPTIVDVSSGVETNQIKNKQKVCQFIKNAKGATYNEQFIQ